MQRRHIVLAGALALTTGLLVGLPAATAATIAVTCPGDSLQAAIDGADPGDSITIATGTCAESVRVHKNLTITGAGRTATTIDGSGAGTSTIEVDAATTVTISHLAITGGDTALNGGGILVEPGATLSLAHADVRGNRALRGGGIYTHAGSTTNLTSVLVTGNEAAGAGAGGGGIRNVGHLFATDVQIVSNEAPAGGGLMLPGTAPVAELTDVTIRDNTATTGPGGGILNNAELVVHSGEINDNQALGGEGGGINSGGTAASISLTATTVAGNTSMGDGAGIHMSTGPATIDRSTISGNDATGTGGVGGAVYLGGTATLMVTNSTLSGNTATNAGGGLATASTGAATFVHSTITGNTASSWGGGGIAVSAPGTATLTASILAGNIAPSGPDCKPGVTSTGHNIVGDTTNCIVAPAIIPDMLDTDPRLGPLRDNTGPTMTHAPAVDSPALDAFAPLCGAALEVDQRGLPRPAHPLDDCDIGAVENYPPRPEDDAYTVQVGGTLTVRDPGPLDNDTDREGHAVRWSHTHPDDPAHGTLTKEANGAFTYVHDGSDTISDSFRYYVTDGTPVFTQGTVTITITPIPHVEDTVGLVDPTQGQWHLRNSAGTVTSFYFGNPGDYPMMGDWDCDGVETPGLYRQTDGYVYLSNANESRIADVRFYFGDPGDVPLAGDFDGDGCDTVSIYRPDQGQAFIINELGENEGGLGAAEFSYFFGNPGDKPFVGDFTGDGVETVGLHRESTGLVYFRTTHTPGVADLEFIFGDPGDRLVCGDWGVVDGVASPALFRPSTTTMFFRHSNTAGVADAEIVWGETGWLPVAGAFGLG